MHYFTLLESAIDFTAMAGQLGGITDSVKDAIPAVMPTVVTFMGIRKGVSFFTGLLRSA